MAEENIRGDTQQKTPPIENEQLSDIILILDKMELLIQAVSKLGKDGKHETVPADEKHKNSFLKVDKFSSIVENFLKNFWSQIKDPTHFGILTMKMNEMDKPENKQAIKDLAEGKKTDAVAEFLKKYEIKPKDVANEQSNNKKNDETMAKKTAQQEQTQVPATQNDQPKYRYNEAMINWDQLKNFGLSKEFLQEKGLLDQMLKGYKTNQTVPITMNFGSAVLRLLSSVEVQDAPSGFRAFSRQAALQLNVFDNYTYTMETLLQANAKGLKVISVPIGVNPMLRKSKLVKNIFDYVFKSTKTTIRMFIVYRPFRFFISIAGILGLAGLILIARFLFYFILGNGNGHVQSLIFASIFMISAIQMSIIAVIGDLLSINRKLMEDVQTRIKKLELR